MFKNILLKSTSLESKKFVQGELAGVGKLYDKSIKDTLIGMKVKNHFFDSNNPVKTIKYKQVYYTSSDL